MNLRPDELDFFNALRRTPTAKHFVTTRNGKIVHFKTEIDSDILKKASQDPSVPRGTEPVERTREAK